MTVTEAIKIVSDKLSESFDKQGADRAALVLDSIRVLGEISRALNTPPATAPAENKE